VDIHLSGCSRLHPATVTCVGALWAPCDGSHVNCRLQLGTCDGARRAPCDRSDIPITIILYFSLFLISASSVLEILLLIPFALIEHDVSATLHLTSTCGMDHPTCRWEAVGAGFSF
jgi:hypothetical protein